MIRWKTLQLARLDGVVTGAWLAAVFDTVVGEASMAPRVSRQASMQAVKRLFSIKVSNFMVVLREWGLEVLDRDRARLVPNTQTLGKPHC